MSSPSRASTRRRRAMRPLIDALETRIQLSITVVTNPTVVASSTYDQVTPSVAMDAEGDYVVAWVDNLDKTAYTTAIEAQVFNPNGTAKTGVITVNSSSSPTDTTRSQPSVAMDANGDFVVAWSLEPANQPTGGGYYYDIEARRFNLAGTGQGNEFQVNTTQTTTSIGNPTVAMDGTNFVVSWLHGDGVNATVHAKLYSDSGTTNTAITSEFNVSPALRSFDPGVAMDSSGDFVATWDTYNPTSKQSNVFAQIYNASGVAQGGPIAVDSAASTINPSVAIDGAGHFVIGYEIYGVSGNTGYADVYVHQYALTGSENSLSANSLSGDVEVDPQSTTYLQAFPSVGIDSQGFATIAWEEFNSSNASANDSIDAIRVNPDGTVIQSSPIVVAPASTSVILGNHRVAVGADGDVAITWQVDPVTNPTPGSGETIDDSLYEYVNNAPTLSSVANQKIAENGATTVPLSGITAGGNEEQTLTVTASSNNTSLIVPTVTYTSPNSTGTLNLAPIAGQFGSATITVTVTDSGGTANGGVNSTSVQFTLTVVGNPTANAQSVTVPYNTAKAITLTGSDPNSPPLSLTYTVATQPAHGTLSGTAPNLTYTPAAGYHGADSFTFTDNDGSNTSAPATVSITVSAGTPTANPQTVPVAHDSSGTPITLTGSDPDSPPLALTYTVATQPAHGTLSGTAPNLTYTPAAGYHGADSFTFTDNNGSNTSAAATVTLNVAVGTPTANSQTEGVAHDSTGTPITLTGTDDDTPALTQTFVVTAQPSHGTLTGTAPNLTYKPAAGYHGSDTFQFTDSNGTNTSAPATETLNVAVGTPMANAQAVSVPHDGSGTAITLTGTDDDTPALTQTYLVASQPSHGTLSGTAPNLTYTPAAGYHGADSFTFTDNNGSNTSAAATVTLNVAVGTPTANAQTVSVAHDSSGTPITLTDTDDDTPALTQTFAFTQPAHGTVTVSGSPGSPTVVYAPAAGYHGADSFTFTANNGTNTSAAATVTLNVAVGTPTANSQTVGVAHDSSGTPITLTGSDDDTPALTQTYLVASQPSHGTLSGTAPNLTYTPTAGYHGTDSFTFTDGNGTNTSTAATVTLNVAVGTPTANAQSVNVATNTATPITLSGTDDDTPALTQTFVVTAQPSHGTLSGTSPNLTYTPAAGYTGPDSFQFTDSNGTNISPAATVTITVATAQSAPQISTQPTSRSVIVGQTATFTAAASGNPAPTVQWEVSTNGGGTFAPIAGATSTTYQVVGSTSNNGNEYEAVFTNSVNTATTNPATLTVQQAAIGSSVGVAWGTAGTATLQTNADGLRLLPAGRNTDMPWLGIDKISITLNAPESLSASDVSVTGVSVANYGPVTISGSGTNYTITLAQPINAADRVTVTIGNASIATYTRRLDVLPGDFNDDGLVSSADMTLINNATIASYNVLADIDGDGAVTTADVQLARKRIGTSLPA